MRWHSELVRRKWAASASADPERDRRWTHKASTPDELQSLVHAAARYHLQFTETPRGFRTSISPWMVT